jgi:hypothetical protein
LRGGGARRLATLRPERPRHAELRAPAPLMVRLHR